MRLPKHSLLPWKAVTHIGGRALHEPRIASPDGVLVAWVNGTADAERIVLCVNSHDALVDALAQLTTAVEGLACGDESDAPAEVQAARAALKLAGK